MIEFLFFKLFRRIMEHGIFHEFSSNVPVRITRAIFGEEANKLSVHLKVTWHVERGSGNFMAIGWKHFRPVINVLLIGLVSAILGILFEKFMAMYQMKVSTKPPLFVPISQLGERTRRALTFENERWTIMRSSRPTSKLDARRILRVDKPSSSS